VDVAVFILFLVPVTLITFASVRMNRSWDAARTHDWRNKVGLASVVVGWCAIFLGYAAKVAWLRAGGDPHGMGTPRGVWVPLHKLFLSALLIDVCLAIAGRGRGRVLTLVAIGVAFGADTMIYFLQAE